MSIPLNVGTISLIILVLTNLVALAAGVGVIRHIVNVDLPEKLRELRSTVQVDVKALTRSIEALSEVVKHLEKSLIGLDRRVLLLEDRQGRTRE